MALENLVEKGNLCIKDRENIPGAPLWHMGKVAVFESKPSFDLLQNTIDYLTCKGKTGKSFAEAEKEFMKELFEALWWGGNYRGYREAAKLADHYVNGDGKTLRIDSDVYEESAIVTGAMKALKGHIKQLSNGKKPVVMIKTSDPDFLRSTHAKSLKQGARSAVREGYILGDGALLVEQSNHRLKNADHRFHLGVYTTKTINGFYSRWTVESQYDFEPFEKGYVTEVPLAKGFVLKLPDGLSHHLTKIGVAKDFRYTSEWSERWE